MLLISILLIIPKHQNLHKAHLLLLEEHHLPAIDDIDLVKRYAMHDFLVLLELPIGTQRELGLGSHGIVVPGSRKRPPGLCDLLGGLVDGDDVSILYLLLPQRLC